MAVRHIKEYFEEIAEQYHEMLENIRDFEKDAEKGLIEPERIDQLKEQIKPVINNYQQWSYVMFLLNKPNKKQKEKGYVSRNKKLLQNIDSRNTVKGILTSNKNIIDNMKI